MKTIVTLALAMLIHTAGLAQGYYSVAVDANRYSYRGTTDTSFLVLRNNTTSVILDFAWDTPTTPFAMDVTAVRLAPGETRRIMVLADMDLASPGTTRQKLGIRVTAPNGEYQPSSTISGLRLNLLANPNGPSINFGKPIVWLGPNEQMKEYETHTWLHNDGITGVTITKYEISGPDADKFRVSRSSLDYIDLVDGVEHDMIVEGVSDGSGKQLSADLTVTARTASGDVVTATTTLTMGPANSANGMLVEPPVLAFGENDISRGPITKSFVVRNLTSLQLTMRSIVIRDDANASFELLTDRNLPSIIAPYAAVSIDVRFTPSGQGAPTGQIVIACEQPSGRYLPLYVDLTTIPDTMAVRPAYVSMQTTPATFGDTARVSLTLADGLDELITRAEFTLRFRNSDLQSVTAPVTTQSEGGFTMSTFAFDVTKHSAQTVLGELDFIVLSGAGTKVPIDVVSVQWFDNNNTPLDAQTIVNGAVVSVLSEESSTFTAAPLPITDVMTVFYPEMTSSGTLEMMNINGVVVSRADIATGTTSTAINTSSLPSGVYTVVLHTPNGILRKLVVR